jgi:cystathionine beta-lyase
MLHHRILQIGFHMTFPTLPDRKPTYSYKWEKYKGKDIIPLWVADTEFACAPEILNALHERVSHGVLGYTLPAQHESANQAVVQWCKKQYGWTIEQDWIVWTPGVVPAFNTMAKAFGQTTKSASKGRILIQEPNYPPLRATPALNHCEPVSIKTIEIDGRWTLDFNQLEQEAAHPDTHLFILCNPMNPVGSVLTLTELNTIGEICHKHGVFLCSDEIHCDLILNGALKHTPASSIPVLAENSVTLMAASKTFNIAGLGTSFAIIPNTQLRAKFNRAAMGIVPWANVLGLVATEAAFTQCDDWLVQQKTYLQKNRAIVVEGINAIEGLKLIAPDATFLAWVDASGLNVENPLDWCESKGVGPSGGADFGWNQYIRINFGCSTELLNEALTRLSNC